MRLVLRFIVLGVFAAALLLLSIPSAKPITRVQKIRGKLPHRIVSFGDAYSVNSKYQFQVKEDSKGLLRKRGRVKVVSMDPPKVSPPNRANKEMLKAKLESAVEELPDIQTPEVWTKRLCDLFACDLHHNFASASKAGVDNKVYLANSTEEKAVDFQEQLTKWTELEKSGGYTEEGETLFTVWFGISDVLRFTELPLDEGVVAIKDSITSLFNGLSYISEHWSSKTRILIPYAIDISLLPAFTKLLDRTSDPDRATEIQRNAVFLSSVWNQDLEIAGSKWKNGQLMLWNVHEWFTSEVRAANAWSKEAGVGGFGAGKGLSKSQAELKRGWSDTVKAGWSNVREPCVERRRGRWSVCEDSENYLMWDDFRLGARAHGQLAKDAYKLIKDNWVSGENVLSMPTGNEIRWLWAGSRGIPKVLPE